MTRPSRPHVPSGSESEAVVGEVYPGVWVDPHRLGGQPCLTHTRMTTAQLDRMMRDYGREFIARGWPELTDEQIETACRYEAAQPARTQQPDLSGGAA